MWLDLQTCMTLYMRCSPLGDSDGSVKPGWASASGNPFSSSFRHGHELAVVLPFQLQVFCGSLRGNPVQGRRCRKARRGEISFASKLQKRTGYWRTKAEEHIVQIKISFFFSPALLPIKVLLLL